MSKFKVGDIVKGIDYHYGYTNKDMTKAKVLQLRGENSMKIKYLEGKDRVYIGTNFDVNPEHFELVTSNKECIIITRSDNKVIAVDKSTGKKAIATCSSEDDFDFMVGANLAFTRLMLSDDEDDEIRVGDKVRVINTGATYTSGYAWFERNNIDIKLACRYAFGESLGYMEGVKSIDDEFIVIAIADERALIERRNDLVDRRCYLVGLDGLEKY